MTKTHNLTTDLNNSIITGVDGLPAIATAEKLNLVALYPFALQSIGAIAFDEVVYSAGVFTFKASDDTVATVTLAITSGTAWNLTMVTP